MAKIQRGKIVNRAELAAIHGVSLPTVDTWRNAGCPVEREGGKGATYQYNTKAVIEWRLQQARADKRAGGTAGTLDEAKLRKETANAELAEIELAEKRAQVVPIDHVAKQFGKVLATVKARMLAIPTKAAPEAHIAKSEEEARALIEDFIRDAMTELVDYAANMEEITEEVEANGD